MGDSRLLHQESTEEVQFRRRRLNTLELASKLSSNEVQDYRDVFEVCGTTK